MVRLHWSSTETTIHPYTHPSLAGVCGGRRREREREDGEGGGGWLMRKTLLLSDWPKYEWYSQDYRGWQRLIADGRAAFVRCFLRETECLFPAHISGRASGWRAPCCPGAPAPACLAARLPAGRVAPCWSLQTSTSVSSTVNNIIHHHVARTTVFQRWCFLVFVRMCVLWPGRNRGLLVPQWISPSYSFNSMEGLTDASSQLHSGFLSWPAVAHRSQLAPKMEELSSPNKNF